MIDGNTKLLNAEQITVIVNEGQASRILKYAKDHGIKGGTILRGKGTVNNKFLEYIGLHETHKELVYFVAPTEVAERVLNEISEQFHLDKANQGIAYTTPVCNIVGTRSFVCEVLEDEGDVDQLKYHAVTIIVDDGKSGEVVDAAKAAGAKGGTVVQARGSGIHEHARIFNMDIEPEKEIVLILTEEDSTDQIIENIAKELKMEEPGNGIIFVQNTVRTYGIFR